MKRATTSTACFLLLFCFTAAAQEAKKVQEPEFIGVVFVLNPATGELIELERQTPIAKVQMKAMGIGGAKVTTEMNGEKSPVRFRSDQSLTFVVRVPDPREDPNGTFGMSFYESKKGKRVRGVLNVKAFGMGSSTPKVPVGALDVKLSRYGESSLTMEVLQSFPPGEFCVGHKTSKYNFCFGIDPAVPTTK